VTPEQLRTSLGEAISSGNFAEIKRLVKSGADVNALGEDGGSPLSSAAFHGQLEHVRFLLQNGANLTRKNRDGNTPLHVAAFMGRVEIVKLLLAKGGRATTRNEKRETPIDVVSGEWNDGLAGFYAVLNNLTSNKVDLEEIRKVRPRVAKLLKGGAKSKPAQAKARLKKWLPKKNVPHFRAVKP
jgi:ankyrin repeat protein